jgi:hypothetical protein
MRTATRRTAPRRLATAVALLAALVPVATALAAAPAAAVSTDLVAGPPGVTWGATIDGHDVGAATGNDPVKLPAGRDVRVDLAVRNDGAKPITVRNVRLEGRVIGMSFYSFTTQVDLVVQPGATGERAIRVDLGELGDQAVGLIPARLSLLGPDRSVVARQSLATDVRGSLISAYGLFGLAIAGITLILVVGLALEIARHRLPVNRWRRAVRFLAPGIGLGLTATFSLSATRLLIPGATVWVPLVLGCGGVAFVVGYLTPPPREAEREYEDEMVAPDRYELPGYAGASRGAFDPYGPPSALPEPVGKAALQEPTPQPALSEPAPQPGLDEYLPGKVAGGKHRGPAHQPDVVQLPNPDQDRTYRS